MARTIRQVRPQPLAKEAWSGFGWMPVPDTDPTDGVHRLAFAWGDPHVNVIAHSLEELEQVPGALRCRVMFRHDTHTQTLMSLDARAVIAVAPADDTLEAAEDLEGVRAFVLEPLEAIVLHRGTWHWGPYPLGARSVRLFNVQGFGYREDNRHVDLAAAGLAFDIPTDSEEVPDGTR